MRELRELQRALARAIVSGDAAGASDGIVSTAALSARDRLGLYIASHRRRTAAALESAFPLTAAAVADGFAPLVEAFLDRWRGGGEQQLRAAFAAFLASSGRDERDPALRHWAAFVAGIAATELPPTHDDDLAPQFRGASATGREV